MKRTSIRSHLCLLFAFCVLLIPSLSSAASSVPAPLRLVASNYTYPGEGWDNAIDGDTLGWDGTVSAKASSPYAIFAFTDNGIKSVSKVRLLTDTGVGYPERWVTQFTVQVSTTGTKNSNFATVLSKVSKSGGAWQEYILPPTKTKYIKLILDKPRSGWRQIGEFEVYADETPPPDTQPPVISNVASSGITSSGATITWSTNEPADSQVEYGLTTSYGSSTPLDSSSVTAHSVTLSGLSASTTYHYRVKSKDAAGNLAVSGDYTLASAPAGRAYYIDSDASGLNNGTSWADAWTSFSRVNWGVIQPGDTLYLSGGTSSKTYFEMLDVGASGVLGNPIVISRGMDAGHNGEVILDGQLSLDYGVRVERRAFVVVNGLTVRNYVGSGQIRVRYSSDVTVQNNQIYVTGHGGVYLHDNDRVTVRGNWITTPSYIAAQTDGIYSQLNVGNIYEGNHIVISNEHNVEPICHDDAIQMYVDTDITVRNNYIEQNNSKVSNAQGIYATNSYGTFEVYNNVVYGPNTKNCLLTLAIYEDQTYPKGDARLIAYHNTLVGGGWGVVYVKDAPDSIVQNNILVTFLANGWLFRLDGSLADVRNADYNFYYAPNSGITSTINGVAMSWEKWQAGGYEAHGIKTDPLLVDIANRDFSLSAGSQAIDAGNPIPSVLTDFSGLPRPQGPGYDIGAYELRR